VLRAGGRRHVVYNRSEIVVTAATVDLTDAEWCRHRSVAGRSPLSVGRSALLLLTDQETRRRGEPRMRRRAVSCRRFRSAARHVAVR